MKFINLETVSVISYSSYSVSLFQYCRASQLFISYFILHPFFKFNSMNSNIVITVVFDFTNSCNDFSYNCDDFTYCCNEFINLLNDFANNCYDFLTVVMILLTVDMIWVTAVIILPTAIMILFTAVMIY